jgi:hypothetical protein
MNDRFLGEFTGWDLLDIARRLLCKNPSLRLNIWQVLSYVEIIRHRLFFGVEEWPDILVEESHDGRVTQLCAALDAFRTPSLAWALDPAGKEHVHQSVDDLATDVSGKTPRTVDQPMCELMKQYFQAITLPVGEQREGPAVLFPITPADVIVPRASVPLSLKELEAVRVAGRAVASCVVEGYHHGPPLALCCVAYIFSDQTVPDIDNTTAEGVPCRVAEASTEELIEWLEEIDAERGHAARTLWSVSLNCSLCFAEVNELFRHFSSTGTADLKNNTKTAFVRQWCIDVLIYSRKEGLEALKEGFYSIATDSAVKAALGRFSTSELQTLLTQSQIASPLASYTASVECVRPLDPNSDVDVALRNIVVDFLQDAPSLAAPLFLRKCTSLDWVCRPSVQRDERAVYVSWYLEGDSLYESCDPYESHILLFRPKLHTVLVPLSEPALAGLRGSSVADEARTYVWEKLVRVAGVALMPASPPLAGVHVRELSFCVRRFIACAACSRRSNQ